MLSRNIKTKIILIITLTIFIIESSYNSYAFSSFKNYQGIVLGKIIKTEITREDNFYITKYKLKVKKWLYKNPSIEKSKYLTVKILGAELAEKGIVIKASTSPDFISTNKDAIFFLESTKNKNNIFTISRGGIIYKEKKEKKES